MIRPIDESTRFDISCDCSKFELILQRTCMLTVVNEILSVTLQHRNGTI